MYYKHMALLGCLIVSNITATPCTQACISETRKPQDVSDRFKQVLANVAASCWVTSCIDLFHDYLEANDIHDSATLTAADIVARLTLVKTSSFVLEEFDLEPDKLSIFLLSIVGSLSL